MRDGERRRLGGTGGPPPAQVIIGLDVGTTGVKAVAFGIDSPWRAIALREYPLIEPEPGQAVQDPATLLVACREVLATCVAQAAGAEVVAVSTSAAMHGLMALDGGGRPLTPLLTWADARATREARRLRRDRASDDLPGRTGTPLHPMSPLAKLAWFAAHQPEVWRDARWWVGLKDWVLYWLTGEVVTELSSASATGLLSMTTGRWFPAALAACGVEASRLPPILAPDTVLPLAPATAAAVGLPPATPVVAGAADGPLANVGAGALGPGVAALSLGTSGALRLLVDRPGVDEARSLFCYALDGSSWVLGAAISNGASVLRWAGSVLAPDLAATEGGPADAAVAAVAESAPAGCDGLVMVPYLLAERAPLWDPDLPGAYLGLRRGHTRAHLLRAGVEGVCMQVRLVLDRLEAVAEVRSLRATGGAFRSRIWGEVMAAMLDRPLGVVGDTEEGSALGAAALGLVALGRAATLEAASVELGCVDAAGGEGGEVRTIDPAPDLVAVYRDLRATVPGLVDSLAKVAALFGPTPPAGAGGA